MSEVEDHEADAVKDDFNNDTVDFDFDDEVGVDDAVYSDQEDDVQPISMYNRKGRISPTLTVITEETSVYSRRPSPVNTDRIPGGVSPENSAETSAFGEAFGGSFGGACGGSNMSAEFGANGIDALAAIQQFDNRANPSVKSKLDTSQLNRLEIPPDFSFGNCEAQNSWDKGPVTCDLKFDSEPSRDQAPSQSQPLSSALPSKSSTEKPALADLFTEAPDPSKILQKEAFSVQQSVATPEKQNPIVITTTPVRPRPKSFTRRDTQTLQHGLAHSTPKVMKGSSAIPDFGDISAINVGMNNVSLDSTVGDPLSKSQISTALGKKSSIDEIMAQLEALRTQNNKKNCREKSVLVGRPPLKEMPRQVTETPVMATHMDGTMFKTAREMSFVPSAKENKSGSSSYHTASQHSRSTASSRVASSDTMSDMYSRPPSTVNSMQDCISRPDTRLSTASSIAESGYSLKFSKFLCFGNIDVGATITNFLPVTNRGQLAVTLRLSLRKENSGYKILGASMIQLEPGEAERVRVEFKPTTNQRHNNQLVMEITNTGEVFKVPLRGTGGMASVAVEGTREQVRSNKFGAYLLKPGKIDDSIFFKLVSKGKRKAFCVVVVCVDQQPVPCEVLPCPNFTLKAGMEQEVQIKIENIGRFLTGGNTRSSTHSLDSDSSLSNPRLQISVFWGDEVQRQRVKAFLAKNMDFMPKAPIMTSFLGEFKNEKPFVEPSDYPVQQSDVKLFEIGLSKADIMVTPLAIDPSNFPDCDMTMTSEHSFANSIYNERTLVPDGDETVMPRR